MHKEGIQTAPGSDPHQHKHACADVSFDVEVRLGRHRNLEGNANNTAYDSCRTDNKARNEGDDRQAQRPPACVDGHRRQEDHEECDDSPGDEEAEHDVGCDAKDIENGENLSGKGDGSAVEELGHEDLDRVEPVEVLGFTAVGDSDSHVSFAEIPEADLVEVVESYGLSDRVDQAGTWG